MTTDEPEAIRELLDINMEVVVYSNMIHRIHAAVICQQLVLLNDFPGTFNFLEDRETGLTSIRFVPSNARVNKMSVSGIVIATRVARAVHGALLQFDTLIPGYGGPTFVRQNH